MNEERCENCKFYDLEYCRRFPESVSKSGNSFCGEFINKNTRQLLNESITYSEYSEY